MPRNFNKYKRGREVSTRDLDDKKLKGNLQRHDKTVKEAAARTARAEVLLATEAGYVEAEGMERTYHFKQDELRRNVDAATAAKMFDLQLEQFGPYALSYTRNGRRLLIGGERGHLATFDWHEGKLGCEVHVRETVRDVTWLHNDQMFAVAQKKYAYIYDASGAELHCLRSHVEPTRLQFLPYHFLLASVGSAGWLKYQDTSTGQLVAELRTRLGPCNVLAQNPSNAILHAGHGNGTVTLWSPNMSTPLVKMLCHRAAVRSVAVDASGRYMVSTGADSQVRVWDVRTFKALHAYATPQPAVDVRISQTGAVGLAFGPHVQVWTDALRTKASAPHLNHLVNGGGTRVHRIAFAPFEDFLGIGHSAGVSSMVVPGSGEANFDALELNPFETKKQRQEHEVKMLLEKIQPNLIALDPNAIGKVDRTPKETIERERKREWEANHAGEKFDPKFRMRGKSSSMRRYLRKEANIVDANRIKLREKLDKAKLDRARAAGHVLEQDNKPKSVLDRFTVKSQSF